MKAGLLTMRALVEAGTVAGFGYWGFHTGGSAVGQIVLAFLAPAVGFGLSGGVDFRRTGRLAEPLRLSEELVISGLAAVALYTAGQRTLGVALAAVSIVYHGLVYATGSRLLERTHLAGSGGAPAEPDWPPELRVRIERTEAVSTIACAGRVNAASRAPLEAALRESLAGEPDAIRFDLRDARIDSSGVALVLALYDECLRSGVRIEALTAPATREVFTRLGLPLRFRIEKNGQMVRVIPAVPTGEG
jgi:ABC-type transporter Mla MlaB component